MDPVIAPMKLMTYDQRQILRLGLDSLRPISRPFSLLFYGKLFELEPETRALFSNDLAQQGRKLMSMLDAVVMSLEDFEPMRTTLQELGRKHVRYGVREEQYATLTQALLWALAQALEADFDASARDAWTRALKQVTDTMIEGAHDPTVSPN